MKQEAAKNMMAKVKDAVLRIIFQYLPEKETVVFLFGSFANGDDGRGSDIDIGVFQNGKIDREIMVKMKDELEEKVKTLRNIDLVDFCDVFDDQFIKEALKEITIWHQTPTSKISFQNFRRQINA